MSAISCHESKCNFKIKVLCNCTSPPTYSCKKHLIKHCESSEKPHNFTSIFSKPVLDTKEAILNLLTQKKLKTAEIKAKILTSFYQTIYSIENLYKGFLKEIDYDATKICSYFDKIWKTNKVSKLEKDPVLSLLMLQSYEAIERAKAIFSENNKIELINNIKSQIDQVISSLSEERTKFIKNERLIKRENINIRENKESKYMQEFLNEFKEAINADPNNSDAYNKIGEIFYIESRYEEAIKCYDNAIRINPNCALYYKNKGKACAWSALKELIECYNEAIRIDPNNETTHYILWNVFHRNKIYAEAIKFYDDAININPNCAYYYLYKGKALKKLDRGEEEMECYKEAIWTMLDNNYAEDKIKHLFYKLGKEKLVKYYDNTIRINPKCAIYYEKIGDALKELKRNKDAVECYEEAIRINPKSLVKLSLWNAIHDAFGWKEAAEYYDHKIRTNSNETIYYRCKGFALKGLNKIEEAIECFLLAIRINPNDYSWEFEIYLIYYSNAESAREEALKYYDNAIKINPNSEIYYQKKGVILEKLNRMQEARKCYKEAIRIKPDNDSLHESLWKNFSSKKRYEEAMQYYDNEIRINPNCSFNYLYKGKTLIELGRMEEAMAYYEVAIRINTEQSFYILLKSEDEIAVKCCDIAIRINPNCASYYKYKGEVLGKLERNEEAIECYKQAARIEPDDWLALNQLWDIVSKISSYEEVLEFYDNQIRMNPNNSLYYGYKVDALRMLGKNEEAMEYSRKVNKIHDCLIF